MRIGRHDHHGEHSGTTGTSGTIGLVLVHEISSPCMAWTAPSNLACSPSIRAADDELELGVQVAIRGGTRRGCVRPRAEQLRVGRCSVRRATCSSSTRPTIAHAARRGGRDRERRSGRPLCCHTLIQRSVNGRMLRGQHRWFERRSSATAGWLWAISRIHHVELPEVLPPRSGGGGDRHGGDDPVDDERRRARPCPRRGGRGPSA